MDIWFIVMELVMLLGGAFLLGTLAQRLGQSPILGYLKEAGADIVGDEEITMGNMLSQQIEDYLMNDSITMVSCRLGGKTQ